MHLEDVQSPRDIKSLSYEELETLAAEIRAELVATVAQRGGHLASNLGVVELTLALHRVFDMPEDKIIFDVGHQSYVHKLITGRYNRFGSLRSFGGLSGFPKRAESEYDVFETGHSSTALSAALGMARARDFQGQKHHVVALVGDGALTGGLCYEALNDAGNSQTQMIVILNDNEMSIAPNVGALSRHLTDLRVSKGWTSTKRAVRNRLTRIPVVGKPVYRFVHWVKNSVKSAVMKDGDGFFTALGFHYFGPIDGHELHSLEKTLRLVKEFDGPAVVHVLTRKGYGYPKAEALPEQFHGTPPFYVETGDPRKASNLPSFGQVMARELADMAKTDRRIVTITAAMPGGTGLNLFQAEHPDRMLDVGIAEEHAVTLAAGLAAGGMKPYFAVYASFFQRSFDQMIHDVCMQKLPVTFLLDRAGLVGEDGATHHGVFDLASMLPVPNLTVLAPRDLAELKAMIRWTASFDGPCAIRYSRTPVDLSEAYPCEGFTCGKWEILREGTDCALLAVGSMVAPALETAELLAKKGVSAAVVNCSTVKPMDEDMLFRLDGTPLFTMEEHVLTGGFGSAVCAFCVGNDLAVPLITFGVPNTFVQHGRHDQLMKYLGLQPKQMAQRIAAALRMKGKEHER
ncbi:MAG: 1-deoxy-D-xylulose-5-phosphate synthase [Eubacteriales bacterium]|nr:1-deoxy-D-xylulose-5-phosphate synthase [Eubacteriales bacterium]